MITSNVISEETLARTRQRVQSLSEYALLEWAEHAVPGIMRHLDLYRRTKDEAHLVEASMAQWQLQIVLDQIMANHLARQGPGVAGENAV